MISRHFLPTAHGAERQAHLLARTLVGMGHDVRVVSGRFDRAWPPHETIDGIEITRIPSPHRRWIGTWQYTRALRRLLIRDREGYDVVHVMFAKHSAAVAGQLRRRIGRPVVCKPACAGEFGDLAAANQTAFPRRLLNGIWKIDRLIAVSRAIESEWLHAGFPAKKIARIPNGVDARRFRPASPGEREEARRELGLPRDARIMAGVGRLERQKGFGLLIEALGRLQADGNLQNAHLALAGEGARRDELADLAVELGIEDRVHFLGRVRHVEQVYRAADLFVLSSRAEGLSNAMLEAMASGLNVIATRVSGVEDVLRNGREGIVIEPESSVDLAEAIRAWLAGFEQQFGEAARRRVESEFCIERTAESVIALYENLIVESSESRRP